MKSWCNMGTSLGVGRRGGSPCRIGARQGGAGTEVGARVRGLVSTACDHGDQAAGPSTTAPEPGGSPGEAVAGEPSARRRAAQMTLRSDTTRRAGRPSDGVSLRCRRSRERPRGAPRSRRTRGEPHDESRSEASASCSSSGHLLGRGTRLWWAGGVRGTLWRTGHPTANELIRGRGREAGPAPGMPGVPMVWVCWIGRCSRRRGCSRLRWRCGGCSRRGVCGLISWRVIRSVR